MKYSCFVVAMVLNLFGVCTYGANSIPEDALQEYYNACQAADAKSFCAGLKAFNKQCDAYQPEFYALVEAKLKSLNIELTYPSRDTAPADITDHSGHT